MESQLPKLLRDYRRKRKLSQQKLAEILNTEQSYISRIERGDRPGKNSDIDFLWQVSERLSIEPERLGLSKEKSSGLPSGPAPETVQAWHSILHLADQLRSRGDPETAIKHLYPIVMSVAAGSDSNHAVPNNTELLVRTKLALGIALGDRLPPKNLRVAIRLLKEANDAVNPADRDLHIQVLRAYGNELRKNGQKELALTTLHRARALVPNSIVNGSLAIALARAEADMGNWPEFERSIADSHRALDKYGDTLPLFNGLVVHEVVLRGHLSRDDNRGVTRELASSITEPLNLAAQWRVIQSVTMAEGYLFVSEYDLGTTTAQKALRGAEELHLPQQMKRLRDILARYRSRSGALGDLFDAAQLVLSRIPEFAIQNQ